MRRNPQSDVVSRLVEVSGRLNSSQPLNTRCFMTN